MPFESEWVPLNQRTSDIQTKVQEIHRLYADDQIFAAPVDLYFSKDWGSLEQSILYRGLLECDRREEILTASEIISLKPNPTTAPEKGVQEDEAEEPIVVTSPNNAQIGRPLKWFMAQPPNTKIAEEADDQFRIRLLNLYISHVNETGETYYPNLEQMLRANAEFFGF